MVPGGQQGSCTGKQRDKDKSRERARVRSLASSDGSSLTEASERVEKSLVFNAAHVEARVVKGE